MLRRNKDNSLLASVGLLLVFSCVYAIAVLYSFTGEFQALANTAPTVDTITVATASGGVSVSEINLSEDTIRNVYVYGAFSDTDGCGDVKTSGTLQVVFYHSDASGENNCTESNNNCYRGTYAGGGCTISGCSTGGEASANYECTVPLQYYAQASSADSSYWKAIVTTTDGGSLQGANSNTVEVNGLVAINVTSVIDYGPLAIGAVSSSEQTVVITNTGNQTVDVQLSGTAMTCQVGSIPVEAQRHSLSQGTVYGSMTQLSTSSVTLQTNLDKQNTKNIYFRSAVPSSSAPLRGTCSGTNTFIAVQDS